MKKFSLLLSLSLLGLPAGAFDDNFEKAVRCQEMVEAMDYSEQYELGKYFAQAWQTIFRQKDWTPEERAEFDPSRNTTRHGLGGMTSSAQVAITMYETKGEPYKTDYCLMGQMQIFE